MNLNLRLVFFLPVLGPPAVVHLAVSVYEDEGEDSDENRGYKYFIYGVVVGCTAGLIETWYSNILS